ncbi:hypothetical protein CYMTET_3620 [Cymbomonas tetramitiformis]|uniref:VASt domain-containing protein n=1 Tax=Cymbomonas tetramitiformis TaxID=36881 RepID=A0AAE0H2W4_9CHLO|nr:hypothetical protein CYMTET_3620 [Cymbomonas tetramitiformis]
MPRNGDEVDSREIPDENLSTEESGRASVDGERGSLRQRPRRQSVPGVFEAEVKLENSRSHPNPDDGRTAVEPSHELRRRSLSIGSTAPKKGCLPESLYRNHYSKFKTWPKPYGTRFFEAPAAYEDGEHPADEGRGMQEAGGGQSLAGIPGFEPFTGPGTEVLVQLRLQCSAAALNDLLFPNDFSAETFQASLIDKAGGTPGNAEEWMPNAKGQHERKLQARIPATGLPGTFTTKYETQTYLIHEEERVYYVLTVTKTPDVPYGNCFVVETQNLIVADAQGRG